MKRRDFTQRVAAAVVAFGLSSGTAFAQLAPPLPPMPAPSMPQPMMPSPDLTIPTIPDPPQAVAAPPVVEAAPYGIHQESDGRWAVNPGCHWVHPDDEDDLGATCD